MLPFRRLPILTTALLVLCGATLSGCAPGDTEDEPALDEAVVQEPRLMDKYISFRLETDQELTEAQQALIAKLIEAADAMDEIFWLQAYGDPEPLLSQLDGDLLEYARVNYGPWDRLEDDQPFVAGVGPKPPGARFYPDDVTAEEVEAAAESDPDLLGTYTVVRRDPAGKLQAVPYSEEYAEPLERAAALLREASELAEDPGLARYLSLRADALLTDDYYASDMAWMEMKDNPIDVVIGPIETYEDQLFGAKAAAEAFVLVKDLEWSQRLARYADFLPGLQRALPVGDEYKQESPGSESELNAYDVVYVAGDANSGSKTIAINLPNDERVQLARGTRRLQLKNAMRAKFEPILVPIAELLIAEDQQEFVTFDAFFSNTMFHEVAHGLGIKNTITDRGTVREALREQASAMEEGKADVLGLFMISQLHDEGELGEDHDLRDNQVTFVASIFRSIRFGSTSAHGVANLVRFNFFRDQGAFTRDAETGRYRIDFERMAAATNALAERILTLQGDGDVEAVRAFVEEFGGESDELRADLERLAEEGIPVDVVFEQGS